MSDKVRVYEIAEESGATSAEVIAKAKDLGLKLTSPQSAVSFENAEEITNYIMTGKNPKLKVKTISHSKKVVEKNSPNEPKINNRKVYEIANEMLITSAEIIEKAKNLGFTLTSPQSAVSFENAEEITNYIMTGKSNLNKPEKKKNIRVYEIARKIEISNDEVINYAKDLGYTFKNKRSTIEFNIAEKIVSYIKTKITNLEEDKKEKSIINDNKTKFLFSSKKISYDFKYKNILFKGVPGTGKSRTIDTIIENKLNIKNEENILRINIHSSSSNADLMQGIGINSKDGNLEYKEKQGLILNFIQKATFLPYQPFALILEEIQENSLNELIGDLIYLIEEDKRAKDITPDDNKYSYDELIIKITKNANISTIKMPNLVSESNIYKKMILPNNLFIFCTSNYRDDKKVIEDNLLRRFDVIEIYPKYKNELQDIFINQNVSDFLENLNNSILKICEENGEIHPDRFMIGHSIWLNVNNKIDFERAFLKVIIEFKDVKDFHFEDFNRIIKDIIFPFEIKNNYKNYQEWIKNLQNNCYDFIN
jgi:5-methylcytosine-specific restriction enzyme B